MITRQIASDINKLNNCRVNKLSTQEQQQYTQSCQKLIKQQQTLLISTVNVQAEPESSYAPFVRDELGVFYIYVSELAAHTINMLKTAKASILFIQPESDCNNLFARQRLVFQCQVAEVERHSTIFQQQTEALQQKFGETVSLLKSLNDFRLLALTPVQGKYIAGFGKAFSVNVAGDSIQINTP